MTLDGSRTFLVGTGRVRALIDTGAGTVVWKAALDDTLKVEKARVGAILVTHHHQDHVGGIRDVLELDEGGDKEGVACYKVQCELEDARVAHLLPPGGMLPLVDGQVVEVEGAQLQTLTTPGHTRDSTSFLLDTDDGVRAAFVGDCVLGKGTPVIADFASYEASLQRLIDAAPSVLFCGHGPEIGSASDAEDVDAASPSKAVQALQELLAHRRARVEQVAETLGRHSASGLTAHDTARAVYEEAGMKHVVEHPMLMRAATQQTLVALRFLEACGRVRKEARDTTTAGATSAAAPAPAAATALAAGGGSDDVTAAMLEEAGLTAADVADMSTTLWWVVDE